MKKYIVETYYTCTFKTIHSLNDLNDQELSKIDSRTDGDVEVIDVKLNNRKTKKIGEKNKIKVDPEEIQSEIQKQLSMMPGQEKIIMDYYKKNPSASASLRGTLYEEKIINFIKTF